MAAPDSVSPPPWPMARRWVSRREVAWGPAPAMPSARPRAGYSPDTPPAGAPRSPAFACGPASLAAAPEASNDRGGKCYAVTSSYGPRGLDGDLVDLEDLARALDLGVRVDRLEPSGGVRVQRLERLRLPVAWPQEHGVLVWGALGEEAFEVRSCREHDSGAGLRPGRRPPHLPRLPAGEPARSGAFETDHREQRCRTEVPEPRGRFGEALRVREWTPGGVCGGGLQHEPAVCDLAHLHPARRSSPLRYREEKTSG